MSEAIIAAAITALATVLAQIIISLSSARAQKAERARLDQKTDDRLSRIEEKLDEQKRKLDEHNRYSDKIGSIELSLAEITTELKHYKS